tara:strand:- start:2136 stop:2375 length:240 start_codon:yes stop_codon:yes gene_type:complete
VTIEEKQKLECERLILECQQFVSNALDNFTEQLCREVMKACVFELTYEGESPHIVLESIGEVSDMFESYGRDIVEVSEE